MFIFIISLQVVREYIDGLDLETLMKNPSLCPSLRSPEKKMAVSVGKWLTSCNYSNADLRMNKEKNPWRYD